MRAKNARSMVAGLYAEVLDALFVLRTAEGRMRQIEAKNQSIAELINAINNPKTTSNNDAIMREFEKIVINGQVEEELAKLKSGGVRS
jgi:phage shock protein A